jgi:hypothetical protein
MRRKFLLRAFTAAAVLLLAAASFLLISYARWLYRITEANRALAAGDTGAARQVYEASTARLEPFQFLRSPVIPGYRQLVFNQARALYAARQDEALSRMLEAEAARAPFLAEQSEYHFWMGNVECRRALAQKDKQALQAGLQRASESYRRALAAAPNDWDAKYNFELTLHLLDSMRKGREENLERIRKGQMKLLRENSEKDKTQQTKIAPEKRG